MKTFARCILRPMATLPLVNRRTVATTGPSIRLPIVSVMESKDFLTVLLCQFITNVLTMHSQKQWSLRRLLKMWKLFLPICLASPRILGRESPLYHKIMPSVLRTLSVMIFGTQLNACMESLGRKNYNQIKTLGNASRSDAETSLESLKMLQGHLVPQQWGLTFLSRKSVQSQITT